MKTKSSLKKRFRITKKGKILHRQCGQDHFKSRRAPKNKRIIRKDKHVSEAYKKTVFSNI